MYTIFQKTHKNITKGGFDPPTFGLKAQRATSAPLRCLKLLSVIFVWIVYCGCGKKTRKLIKIFPLLSIIIKNPFGQSGNVYNFSGKFSINFCISFVPFLRFWRSVCAKKRQIAGWRSNMTITPNLLLNFYPRFVLRSVYIW